MGLNQCSDIRIEHVSPLFSCKASCSCPKNQENTFDRSRLRTRSSAKEKLLVNFLNERANLPGRPFRERASPKETDNHAKPMQGFEYSIAKEGYQLT